MTTEKRDFWGNKQTPEEFKGDGLHGTIFWTAEEYMGWRLTYDPWGYLSKPFLTAVIIFEIMIIIQLFHP